MDAISKTSETGTSETGTSETGTSETGECQKTMPVEPSVPDLRLEGGDVVFHLSEEEQDIMILPSELLISRSDWFKASLGWQQPQLRPGATVQSWHYGLIYDLSISTWTLQSMEKDCDETSEKWFCLPAQKWFPSIYTTRIPYRGEYLPVDDILPAVDARRQAVRTHKLLLTILLDESVAGLEALEIADLAPQVGNMLSIAEYYQLLEALTSKFIILLSQKAKLDDDILEHPAFYLEVGAMLRSRSMFEEAMRHFVGRANETMPLYKHEVTAVPWTFERHEGSLARGAFREWRLSPEIKDLAEKKRLDLLAFLSSLEQRLLNLSSPEMHTPLFTFRLWDRTIRQETRFLARAVWLDWVTANSPATFQQCTWGGAWGLQNIARARCRRSEWWTWCWQCDGHREGSAPAPCDRHGARKADSANGDGDANDASGAYVVDDREFRGRISSYKPLSTRPKPYKTDIKFLGFGGRDLVGDLLRAYRPRMADGSNALARRELTWCLHEQVREAGNLILRRLLDEEYPPARKMEYESFYVTNMRFEVGDMPWDEEEEDWEGEWEGEEEERQEGEEWEGEEEEEEEQTRQGPAALNLPPASPSWLQAIGMSQLSIMDN